jgi:phage shock protein A
MNVKDWDTQVELARTAVETAFQVADEMADRIEALERERDAYAEQLMVDANTFSEMHLEIEQLRDKISEMQDRINRLTLGGNRR